jgi:uncharacterized membrane protein
MAVAVAPEFARRTCYFSYDLHGTHFHMISTVVALRWVLACFFILAGINHFAHPQFYLAIIPPALPAPERLNQLSGLCEVLGGLGVLVPATRRFSGWGLLALLIAVFPANIQMAAHPSMELPAWVQWVRPLWVRVPLQLVFIAWVWWVALSHAAATTRVGSSRQGQQP